MHAAKMTHLKTIFESTEGVHLTAYLQYRADLGDLRSQLQTVIHQAEDWLNPVMNTEEQRTFLAPVEALLSDVRILKQIKSNIGIFRNESSFRILAVPVPIEPSCQIATSFHIKPLLRWLQSDREFLFLEVKTGSAHLYQGSQDSLRPKDFIIFPESFRKQASQEASGEELRIWLDEWIVQLTKNSKPKLFLVGEKSMVENLNRSIRYPHKITIPIAESFGPNNTEVICSAIRDLLRQECENSLALALQEFRLAEDDNRTQKNIFEIAKAVVQGRVRKLIITDDLSIFGKVDSKSGDLAIHPFDLDHEDDDILDDLAQIVLSHGGEVVVASQDEIPKGRPILAILNVAEDDLEKKELFLKSKSS